VITRFTGTQPAYCDVRQWQTARCKFCDQVVEFFQCADGLCIHFAYTDTLPTREFTYMLDTSSNSDCKNRHPAIYTAAESIVIMQFLLYIVIAV